MSVTERNEEIRDLLHDIHVAEVELEELEWAALDRVTDEQVWLRHCAVRREGLRVMLQRLKELEAK